MAAWAIALLASILPSTEGETLSGRKLRLPDDIAGKSSILVMSLSKEAGERVKAWMDPLLAEGVNAYSVTLLESVPRILRGMVRAGVRSGTRPEHRDRAILLQSNEKAWRDRAQPNDLKLPVLLKLDEQGRITGRWNEAYTRQGFLRLLGHP